jgi:predicted RND superfamily exporter protein
MGASYTLYIILTLTLAPGFIAFWIKESLPNIWYGWCVIIGAIITFIFVSIFSIAVLMAIGTAVNEKKSQWHEIR